MTYIADLDPNSRVNLAADEAADLYDGPIEPSDRFVDYNDVEDPETPLVWRYGYGHAVLIPGASD